MEYGYMIVWAHGPAGFYARTSTLAFSSGGFYKRLGDMASTLDKHIKTIVEGRRQGKSFAMIGTILRDLHGIEITNRGLSAWYRRRQRQLLERKEEIEAFALAQEPPLPSAGTLEITDRFNDPNDTDDDWTAPVASEKLTLKVMKNSNPS